VSQGRKLHFLVDSGADISLVKSYKLLGTAEFEPKDRVRVKERRRVRHSDPWQHRDSDMGRRDGYSLSFPASKQASGSKRRW